MIIGIETTYSQFHNLPFLVSILLQWSYIFFREMLDLPRNEVRHTYNFVPAKENDKLLDLKANPIQSYGSIWQILDMLGGGCYSLLTASPLLPLPLQPSSPVDLAGNVESAFQWLGLRKEFPVQFFNQFDVCWESGQAFKVSLLSREGTYCRTCSFMITSLSSTQISKTS